VPSTYYWVGIADTYPQSGNSTSWSDARNWDLNGQVGVGIPGAGDVAAFSATVPLYHWPDGTSSTQPHNRGPVYDVIGGGSLGAFNMDTTWAPPGTGSSMTVNTPLTVTGTSEWDSGTISIPAGVTLTNGGSLTMNNNTVNGAAAGNDQLQGPGTLVNAPGAVITNAGIQSLDLGLFYKPPTLINQAGASIVFASDATIYSDWNGGLFTNAGTIRKTVGAGGAAATVLTGLTFNNSGTIDVRQGILRNEDAGISTGGPLLVSSGAVLDLTGGQPIKYQGSFTGSGGGTVLLGSGTLRLTGDTLFTFPTGMFQWTGGTLDTQVYTLTNAGFLTLNNVGAVALTGSGTLSNPSGATITQSGAGGLVLVGTTPALETISNAGLYDIRADCSITDYSNGGRFVNAGILRKSVGAAGGAGSVIGGGNTVGVTFSNSGTIDIRQGVLTNEGIGVNTGGTFTVSGGAVLDLTGGRTIQYLGDYVGSGQGTVLLGSGRLQLANNASFSFAPNLLQWTGGTIDTHGFTLTNNTASYMNLSGSSNVGLSGSGSLINNGSMEQTGAGYLVMTGNSSAAPTTLTNSGRYDISADSGITTSNFRQIINNTGVFSKLAGSGTSTVDVVSGFGGGVFNSTGAVSVSSGTLDIRGVTQVSGSALTGGTWTAVAPGTLKINNGVALTSSAAAVTVDGAGASFLNIAGTLAANSGSFSLLHGKTLTENTQFTNSGRLSIGAGGTFTVPGYTQTSAGTLAVQLSGAQYGQLRVTSGTVSLAGALSVTTGLPIVPGVRYVMIDNQTSSPVQGTFGNLGEGQLFASGGGIFTMSYRGGDGNDVVLTALVSIDTPADPLPPVLMDPTALGQTSGPPGQILV
jgi:hypothetical protein